MDGSCANSPVTRFDTCTSCLKMLDVVLLLQESLVSEKLLWLSARFLGSYQSTPSFLYLVNWFFSTSVLVLKYLKPELDGEWGVRMWTNWAGVLIIVSSPHNQGSCKFPINSSTKFTILFAKMWLTVCLPAKLLNIVLSVSAAWCWCTHRSWSPGTRYLFEFPVYMEEVPDS